MREQVHGLVYSRTFQNFIIVLIVLNGVTLGMETSSFLRNEVGGLLTYFDVFALGIFTIEIILKMYALGIVRFFKDPWNVFDFIIVGIALVPASGPLSVLRTLRILRLLRLITVVPQMRKIVAALLSVIPGIASIGLLVGVIFYIYAVLATNLYGESFPQWFGTLGESLYTLFQVMTLESWSMGIVRPIMEQHPYAYVVFVPFILLSTFVMINLVVAVIVEAMNSVRDVKDQEQVDEIEHHADINQSELLQEMRELREQMAVLSRRIETR